MKTSIQPKPKAMALAIATALAFSGSMFAQAAVPPGQVEKITTSSSSLELIEARQTEAGTSSDTVELFRTTFELRSRDRTDVFIRLDSECAAWIDEPEEQEELEPEPEEEEDELEVQFVDPDDTQEEGDGSSQATGASVTAWAEINGQPIPIGDPEDDGSIVLCDSNQNGTLELSGAEVEEILDAYEQSRTASGFNWTVPDVDSGPMELVIFATLDVHFDEEPEPDENGNDENGNDENNEQNEEESSVVAAAVVGKRVLILDRAKAAFVENEAFN